MVNITFSFNLCPWNKRLRGPHSWSGCFWDRKSLAPEETEERFLYPPKQWPHPLRYSGFPCVKQSFRNVESSEYGSSKRYINLQYFYPQCHSKEFHRVKNSEYQNNFTALRNENASCTAAPVIMMIHSATDCHSDFPSLQNKKASIFCSRDTWRHPIYSGFIQSCLKVSTF